MQRGAPPFSVKEVVEAFRDSRLVGLCLKIKTCVSVANAILRCGSERTSTRMVTECC